MSKGIKLESEEYLGKVIDLAPALKKQKVNVNLVFLHEKIGK